MRWLALLSLGLAVAGCAAPRGTPAAQLHAEPPIEIAVSAAEARPDRAPEPAPRAPAGQAGTDLAIQDLIVTQAVYDEPLIVGKQTVARVLVYAPGSQSTPATVRVSWEGQTFTQSASIGGAPAFVDVPIGAPTEVKRATITASVEGAGADSDPSNNTRTVTMPVIKTAEKIVVYFMPVDWTRDQIERYNFTSAFPQFVADTTQFMSGVYPVAQDQLVTDYTMTPHMLAPDEKTLSTNRGSFDALSAYRLYASISRAGRRLRPDAFAIVGVFPPGWLAAHGETKALGFALSGVKGVVSSMFIFDYSKTATHEVGHLFWLYEDYDYFVSPPRSSTFIDRSGYWVQRGQAQDVNAPDKIPTFMSGGAIKAWVDTRIYEYMIAKFIIGMGGQVGEPLVLAATMASQVEPDGRNYPSDYSAAYQRFEPKDRVYVSVAVAGMQGGEKLEARWYRGNQQIASDSQAIKAGEGWYDFTIADRNGFPEDKYRVEIYLDGKPVKTSRFEVKSSSKS